MELRAGKRLPARNLFFLDLHFFSPMAAHASGAIFILFGTKSGNIMYYNSGTKTASISLSLSLFLYIYSISEALSQVLTQIKGVIKKEKV